MNPYDDIEEVDELPRPPRKEIPVADRELLELAARALGAQFEEVDGEGYGDLHFEDGSTVFAWNSLVHSDDTFNLQVDLSLHVKVCRRIIMVEMRDVGDDITEPVGADRRAATRRAVTRAAAAIGKAK